MADDDRAIAHCRTLLIFQTNVADRWYRRAERFDDPFVKFFFYFSGFNALYFAWAKADDLKNSQGNEAGENLQIKNLLEKLSSEEAEEILEQSRPAIEFFLSRGPIQRMGKRTCRELEGEVDEGRSARSKLARSSSSIDRLVALGKILYLVRSNLVHGSKVEGGDDERIVNASVGPLNLLLKRAIGFTEKQF